jgi:prophage regulatory protein
MSDVFLRFPNVRAKVPYSKSWIYLAISEGRFPGPIKASGGGRAALWLESEIDSWIRQQVELSRSSKPEAAGSVACRPAGKAATPTTEPCRTSRFGGTALGLRPGLALGRSPNS